MRSGGIILAVAVGLSLSFAFSDAFAFPKQSRNCVGKVDQTKDGRFFCTVTCVPRGTGGSGGPVSPRPNNLAEAQKICDQLAAGSPKTTNTQSPGGNTGGSMPVPPMPNSPPRTGGSMPVPPMPTSPAMMP